MTLPNAFGEYMELKKNWPTMWVFLAWEFFLVLWSRRKKMRALSPVQFSPVGVITNWLLEFNEYMRNGCSAPIPSPYQRDICTFFVCAMYITIHYTLARQLFLRISRLRVHLRLHQSNFIITNLLWHFISILFSTHTHTVGPCFDCYTHSQCNVCLHCLTCLIVSV